MISTLLMPGFEGTELPAWLESRLRDGLGGVCLFGMNITSREQLRELTAAILEANANAIIAIDEEGGDVSRLYQAQGSPFPGNAVLGRLADAELTYRTGAQVGWELRDVSVGLALAPDADINSNPLNPVIGVRSFGTDPAAVATHVAAWTRGIEATGVASCAKHFPGHGDTAADSHHALPVITASAEELRARELVPFTAAISAGARTIMTSHIVVEALDPHRPATFSRAILHDLLREELGFDGVIVTDALDMAGASAELGIPGAAVAAIAAGADFLCIGTRNTDEQVGDIVSAVSAALADGTIPSAAVPRAAARVRALGLDLRRQREELSIPADLVHGEVAGITSETVRGAFHVSDAARLTLASAAGRPLAWVAIETAPNMAVGTSPWGPFAAGVDAAGVITPESGAPRDLPADSLVVVVGKDLHRHAFAREAIAELRSARTAIVVDMGWPETSFAGVDIATFGASRLVGSALLDLIGRATCASE
jgi:beta-N-acetylhexosaminidase